MSGCTNCKGKSGCTDRKGTMFEALDDALARLYPTRTWGELAAASDLHSGMAAADLACLAEELAQELDAATYVVAGDDADLCDYIYVLALGRPPCAVQVRDLGAKLPDEWSHAPTGQIQERYLRVCVSRIAPMAGVQEVAIDIEPRPDGVVIHEVTRSGVFDAPHLKRMQRLVSILPAYDLTHLDFGEISAPPQGFAPGEWPALFGGEPATANYLFSTTPTTMARTSWVPHGVGG